MSRVLIAFIVLCLGGAIFSLFGACMAYIGCASNPGFIGCSQQEG